MDQKKLTTMLLKNENKTVLIRIAGLDSLLYALAWGVSMFVLKEIIKESKKLKEKEGKK